MDDKVNYCWNCGQPIPFSTGKRKRHYCNDTCRITYKRKTEQSKANTKTEQDDVAVNDRSVATVEQGKLLAKVFDNDPYHLIANYGQPDCECKHCQAVKVNKSKHTLNHGPYKPASELAMHEINRVSLPGDKDYDGVCLDSKYDSQRRAG